MTRKAFLVAINDYGSPANNLPSCVADARKMSEVLASRFGFDDMKQLFDKEATLEAVEEGLNWLFKDAGKDDRLVFYFSGHGYQLPQGSSIDEVLVLQDNEFLVDDRLSKSSQDIAPGTLTVILDSCFSGGMEKIIVFSEEGVEVAKPKRWTPIDPGALAAESKVYKKVKGYRPFGRQSVTAIKDKAYKLSPKGLSVNPVSPDEVAEPRMNGLLLSACDETETASASTSKTEGLSAFTYGIASVLRDSSEPMSSRVLMEAVAKKLSDLSFRQTPQIKDPEAPADLKGRSFVELEEVALKPGAPASTTGASNVIEDLLRVLLQKGKGAKMADTATNEKFFQDFLPILLNMVSKDYQPGAGAAQAEQQKFLGALIPILTSAIPAIIDAATKGYQPGMPAYGGQAANKGLFDILPTLIHAWTKDYQPGMPAYGGQAANKGLFDVLPVLLSVLSKGYQPGAPAGADAEQQKFLGALIPILTSAIPAIIDAATKGYQPGMPPYGGQAANKGLFDVLPVLLSVLSKGYQPGAPAGADAEQQKFLGALIPILTSAIPAIIDAATKGYQPGVKTNGAAAQAEQQKFLGALIPILTSAIPAIIDAATKGYQPGMPTYGGQAADKGLFDILPVLIQAFSKGYQPQAAGNWGGQLLH